VFDLDHVGQIRSEHVWSFLETLNELQEQVRDVEIPLTQVHTEVADSTTTTLASYRSLSEQNIPRQNFRIQSEMRDNILICDLPSEVSKNIENSKFCFEF
jgi:hypothetical protein